MLPLCFFYQCTPVHTASHPFPTRRSSDLDDAIAGNVPGAGLTRRIGGTAACRQKGRKNEQAPAQPQRGPPADRKSTRLNSSHVAISYAVSCSKTNIDLSFCICSYCC